MRNLDLDPGGHVDILLGSGDQRHAQEIRTIYIFFSKRKITKIREIVAPYIQ